MLDTLKINYRAFISYKFFNSLFTGISVGSIFIIYTPLSPSVYSLGGIVLAALMLVVAMFYAKILNNHYFFRISLFVELVLLVMVVYFLLYSYSYQTALMIYIGYQLSFVFGSYLVRAETLALKKDRILTFVDVAKQAGYLIGLAISFLFYKVLEYRFGIIDNQLQVYNLHYILVLVEVLIIYLLVKSFSKVKANQPF
ncbi:MAG TPA: hypothetical protein QGG91_04770 [Flavobacteriales bacterium]|jgi:hypothetical protein|nr:hypothetical protein [Flavobacteriales bacterium]|tara:strand:- start:4851 stop:5444 length:594 start_codon:yes stop_codon:yes gene_type:complete